LINLALLSYVYFAVEGGPAALRSGGSWEAVLNEVPQTVLIAVFSIFLPYFMVWSKCKRQASCLKTAADMMLVTTMLFGIAIMLASTPLAKELLLDISWVVLWFTGLYFVLLSPKDSSGEKPDK